LAQNCWEYKKCGREPGGANADELGVCPAASEVHADGVNFGKNGGRACWAIAGTLCGGAVQGTFAAKLPSCLKCEFYQLVFGEESRGIQNTRAILNKLKQPDER
jgi:hypothetical protein